MVALLALTIVPMSLVSATNDLQVDYLKIDGEQLDPYNQSNYVLEVKRGEELPIRVRVNALADVEDVQVTAGIFGYQYSQYETESVIQTSNVFDLEADRTRSVDLDLEIPMNMDREDYKLRIFVTDKNSVSYTMEYNLDVQGVEADDAVVIKEAYLSPADEVLPGRALSALVKIKNMGDYDLDSVTLSVDVPELNIRDTETLDELEADEAETFEKIILRFPSDAQAGVYDIVYTVKFDEYETTTHTSTVTVLGDVESNSAQETTQVTIPTSQSVEVQGNGAVYPITIANDANSDKTYAIAVSGMDAWGTYRIDPSASVVVPAQSTATAYMYVTADDEASVGEKYFQLSIDDGTESKNIPLTASVVEADSASGWDGLKKVLEIGLIVLVIVLIIVGLVVGFNKLKGSEDDEDDEDKTYY